MRKQIRSKNKQNDRLPVDGKKLNMGNTYSVAPDFYYDIEFDCEDCGKHQIWTASQQKWWYEEAGGYFFSTAVRCRDCRQNERERKRTARVNAGHE
tara:strand:- start:53903 stop:54190 length:288 start_codon:yes stop_codon:yes gene_type:complete